ncbi:MAG: tyrosine-type recombinase/integrase [Planctomycetia bacterium]|nr:tyrosine-type recombinase/integrase [Planctomycetia bacterium]
MSTDTDLEPFPFTMSATLADFFEQCYLRDRSIQQSTAKGYRIHIRRFDRWLERPSTIADLTQEPVNAFLRFVCDDKSPDTARGAKATLLTLWRHAIDFEPAILDPRGILKLERQRALQRATRCWGREQIQRLLQEAERETGKFRGKRLRRADFWRAYILTAYDTGLRSGTLFQLRAEDIAADGPLIVRNQRGKTYSVTISEVTRKAILATNPSTRPFVFRVLERRHFYKIFKQLIEAAGLTGTGEYLRQTPGMIEKASPEPLHDVLPESHAVHSSPAAERQETPKPVLKIRKARSSETGKWRSLATEPGSPQSLYEYFAKVYRPRKLLGKSPRTSVMYLMSFDRFGDYLQRTPTIADLNEEAICGFLEARLASGLAHQTVDKESDKIVALSNYAARKRHIPEFLDIPQINPAETLPTCWQREQVSQLFRACREATGTFGAAPRSVWWGAFHALCIVTGERTEAMLSLRWEWLQGLTLSVPAQVRKGKRKAARYRLPPNVVEQLEELRRYTEREGKIFAVPWKDITSSFYGHYTALLKRAGLPDSRRFKPQCLRRTFASFLEAGGGDATEALGHSDRSVTRESYLDTSITLAGKEAASAIVWRELGLASRPLAITYAPSGESSPDVA